MVATKKVGYHCKATVIDRDEKRKKKQEQNFVYLFVGDLIVTGWRKKLMQIMRRSPTYVLD